MEIRELIYYILTCLRSRQQNYRITYFVSVQSAVVTELYCARNHLTVTDIVQAQLHGHSRKF